MQNHIMNLVENLIEGMITKEEFSRKTLLAAGEFAQQLAEEAKTQDTSLPLDDCEFKLSDVENLVAPADLTLTGQALWYQKKLEEVSPSWQYVKFIYGQFNSAWTILHGRKHDIERKLVDVKVLKPTKGLGNGKKRVKGGSKSFADQIKALNISDEEKKRIAKLINVEL